MKQAMVFAAGLGTRLRPLTDNMPKALVRVGGQPLLWHVVMKLKAAGFERIVVNVHHFAGQIEAYLAENWNFGLDIRISDESSMLLETGGGIRRALPFFDPESPILIHNVDILSNVDLAAFYAHAGRYDATLLVSQRTTKRYLLFSEQMMLRGWTNIETGEVRSPFFNVKTENNKMLAFSGIHVVAPQMLHLLDAMPERFGIVDFYLKYCDRCAIHGYEKTDLRLMDVGKIETIGEAEAFLAVTEKNIR
ncbi:MAG: nucleotidyltransferase family protein [Prevotella sp.]|nr:nucleotidyltransferase family protein [Prevotella sp.]